MRRHVRCVGRVEGQQIDSLSIPSVRLLFELWHALSLGQKKGGKRVALVEDLDVLNGPGGGQASLQLFTVLVPQAERYHIPNLVRTIDTTPDPNV